MLNNIKVIALIVTYNRKELLKKCVQEVLNQTYGVNKIIIVNNCSTDGTTEYLKEIEKNDLSNRFIILNLKKNIGGAGGFYEGIKSTVNLNYDFIWIMDDDTISKNDSLEKMIDKIDNSEEVGFLCSNVLWKDKTPCLMNIPAPHMLWNERLGNNLVRLEATSFVSILINKKAINTVGLPIKDFFIWGDDVEYTTRISKLYKGYMVGDSIVYHYMNENKTVNIVYDNKERISRYYYEYRNKAYIMGKRGIRGKLGYFVYVIKSICNILYKSKDYKLQRIKYILKGIFAGLKFKPNVECLEVK